MTGKRRTRFGSSPASNEGEQLIEIARLANTMLQQSTSMDDVVASLKCTLKRCELALQFYKANDGRKLRALVEDWTLPEIERVFSCKGCSSEGYTTVS